MRRFFRKFANLFRPRAEREMTREMESHLALIQEDFERRGLPPDEAKLAARRTYGSVEHSKELHRETRTFLWIEQLFRDVAYGYRNLRRTPGFTLTAIGALALGIGATTSIFSIVNAMLLKPLGFPDLEDLVVVTVRVTNDSGESGYQNAASPAMLAYWRSRPEAIEYISAFAPDELMNYSGGEVAEQWRTMRASADFFDCVGYRLLVGRTYSREEDVPQGPLVAVIGEGLWKRRFAEDSAVVGTKVSLNNMPYTIIGVVADPPRMREFGPPDEVYVPMRVDLLSNDHGQYFMVVARLKPGITLEQAKERLAASSEAFRGKFPKLFGPNQSFTAIPVREYLVGGIRDFLFILLGAVGLVLLIACTNVANLLLARSASRGREIGIRAAVGASRSRIVRQLLTESVFLSLAGGALGLWLGHAGMRALLVTYADAVQFVGERGEALSIDWRVAGFTVAISMVSGLLFGLFPALHSSRVDLNTTLKDSAGRTATGLRQNKIRTALVIGEVGLAVVLLIGSALLIRSFLALHTVERGFETKNVVTMKTLLTGDEHTTSAGVAETARSALASLRAIPGVAEATAGCCIPLQDSNTMTFEVAGRAAVKDLQIAGFTPISPGYFEVFNIPVKRGRSFNRRDGSKGQPVVIISETMAKQFWKEGDPLNDRLVIGRGIMKELETEPARQIVGVVGDIRDAGLGATPRPVLYIPTAQIPDAFTARYLHDSAMPWIVRTHGDANRLLPAIQDSLRRSTGLPVANVLMMDEVVSRSTMRESFGTLLMTVFGGAALLLASIGIYGLMSYTVEQRTQEIGIRLALGADAPRLRNAVIRQGMTLALIGVTAGLGVAWAVARTLENFLFSVQARDPLVFTAVPVLLSLVALVAVWLPARRALKIDPVEALRCE